MCYSNLHKSNCCLYLLVKKNRLPLIALICAMLSLIPFAAESALSDSALEMTLAHLRQVPCMDEEMFAYHKDTVRALSYPKMRALRVFCTLPDTTAEDAVNTLEKLVFYPLTFDQVKILEWYAATESISIEDGWQLLDRAATLDFTAMQAVSQIVNVRNLTPESTLTLINIIPTLGDNGRWAAKTLFNVRDLDGVQALAGINYLAAMTPEQQGAAETGCLLAQDSSSAALEILATIGKLSDTGAATIQALFSSSRMSVEEGLFWLNHYFVAPDKTKEQLFYQLTSEQQSTLLGAFSEASDYLIWKINNLHAVTDIYGAEISTGALVGSSRDRLQELFDRLHPTARNHYSKEFTQALEQNRRYDAVNLLKQSTARARKETARDLDSANIYILLSHGSELYDSSFRDILVPVLLKRIRQYHHGNLLDFLVKTDPKNGHVSNFIISCAQKGKLTAFFPKESSQQKKILDLVTRSAFQDEQSLILFSATFSTLLEKIQPDVRSYLIDEMVTTIQQPDSTFSLQLRVILQYYIDKHSDLLTAQDINKIINLITLYGFVDLSPFITTDFRRWKQDGRLESLSIFQHDDDGRSSYHSNMRNLIKHGYSPRLSRKLSLLPANDPSQKKARALIEKEKNRPGSMLSELYSLSVREPVILEWYKTINNIELSHAVAVYQDKTSQRRLLRLFLEAEMEMFAQRGHSYWRREQLIEPMQQLVEEEQIDKKTITAINRFMSIGSCGGIRVYTKLNNLFYNSVDILATIGTGKAIVNDPYNRQLFEIIATSPDSVGWEEIARQSASIFEDGRGSDYLLPGSLPAILHKMMDTRNLN